MYQVLSIAYKNTEEISVIAIQKHDEVGCVITANRTYKKDMVPTES